MVGSVAMDGSDPVEAADAHIRLQAAYRRPSEALEIEPRGHVRRDQKTRHRPTPIHLEPCTCPEDLGL